MKKLMFLFFLSSAVAGYPSAVNPAIARKAAENFYSAHYARFAGSPGISVAVKAGSAISREEKTLIYTFDMEGGGWIAIAGDDASQPVIAYSFEGAYPVVNQAPQFTAWMKQWEDALFHLANNPTDASPAISSAWKEILNESYTRDYLASTSAQVKPMLYSNWDQGMYYNGWCPVATGGPGGRCWAGCVPTAMGQIMNFYRWPVTGTGSYTYTDPVYGVQTANFGATTYQWDNMPNQLSRVNDGIAQLLYHLGVSCDLVYGPSGSGMYNHKAAYSLRTFFKYSPQTQYLFRDSTTLNWDSVIVKHLNRGMPLYYAGWSVPNINGHAFVCDGYQDTTYFHFNFGWSGSSNGYFHTSNPSPPGYNFQLAQELIINCYPDTAAYTYPTGCQGNKTLTFFDGSLTDGSGPVKPYSAGADCSWLISPQTATDSVSKVIMNFNYISTNPSDFVKIYDGESTSAPLLKSFSGDTIPGPVSSTGNKLLVKFKAGGGTPGKGFSASYSSTLPVWCTGTQVIVADTAEFTNGSNGFDYANNSNCRWRIERTDGKPLTIYFGRFDTEPVFDKLEIYDLGAGSLIKTLSGHFDPLSPPDSVTSPSGRMFIIFSTNSSITGKGWEIHYPRKSSSGANNLPSTETLNVYPNPTTGMIFIRGWNETGKVLDVEVISPEGEILLKQKVSANEGINPSNLAAGIYFIRITNGPSVTVKKIIIL
jgi:hypothetical protein